MGKLDTISITYNESKKEGDASKMLEAALQQMDGIISSSTREKNQMTASTVLSTAQSLSIALQQAGSNTPPPDPATANIIKSWLDIHSKSPDMDERIRGLQEERDSLSFQVQVLTEQVSVQNDKIVELERNLTEKTQLLNNTEDLLQKEVLSRAALETQKLELMSAMSELRLQQAALERENVELRSSQVNNNSFSSKRNQLSVTKSPAITSTNFLSNSGFHRSAGNLQQYTNAGLITPKTPPASFRHQVNPHFSSLPRTAFSSSGSEPASSTDDNANPKPKNVFFAGNQKIIESSNEMLANNALQSRASPPLGQKSKGIRGILEKLRRSNSGNLEDILGEGEFKRGGTRATAGARLEWSQHIKTEKHFKNWNIEDICTWFEDMGLSCYENDLRRWLKVDVDNFFKASPIDIEKELNLKMPLHKKKIILAKDSLMGKYTDDLILHAGKLDTSWVMRWLEDVGLPQHKDAFLAGRVDGRVLHTLTIEDLCNLHITSCLHVASVRRGIQVMRENKWNPDCFIRRSNGEGEKKELICLWTAHRVMEWLRMVDLAEYAPNLRGAGVHGALLIYEPRFTEELLADLLSIPPSKTLLRRHLATHFKELLGRDIIQEKRKAENSYGYQPLTIAAKIKTPKKSQFSLRKKKNPKSTDDLCEYVCPMEPSDNDFEESEHGSQGRSCLSSNWS